MICRSWCEPCLSTVYTPCLGKVSTLHAALWKAYCSSVSKFWGVKKKKDERFHLLSHTSSCMRHQALYPDSREHSHRCGKARSDRTDNTCLLFFFFFKKKGSPTAELWSPSEFAQTHTYWNFSTCSSITSIACLTFTYSSTCTQTQKHRKKISMGFQRGM